MIKVTDLEETQPADSLTVPEKLTLEDESKLDYLDATIEAAVERGEGKGGMFAVPIHKTLSNATVIAHLKRKWESGGWIVGAFPVPDGFQVIFARPPRVAVLPAAVEETMARRGAPPSAAAAAKSAPKRAPKTRTPLLVRMPTRGRPLQALEVLKAYRGLAEEQVAIEVVIDADDTTMNNTQMLQALCQLGCSICIGNHRSKIEAVNSGEIDDWAILALASDDMVPIMQGYDRKIVEAMEKHFPLLDGAVYFNDGYNRDHVEPNRPVLCTFPIMGRHLYDQFGYVYYPEYGSIYCDTEQTDLLAQMKRLAFVDECIIEHRHHAAGKASCDAVYAFNDNKWGPHDKALYLERSQVRQPSSQFSFDAPPMWLSILVCSTTERAPLLQRLVAFLRSQARRFPRQVEIVVNIDGGELPVGMKRQQLLEQAVGHFVAFVDDDDFVAHDYVERILAAVKAEPDADCVSLVGTLTTNGQNPEKFTHSIQHGGWYTEQGVHYRTPNHLNPIRRRLALCAGFQAKDVGEDHDFSNAIKPLLKCEASGGAEPLYLYWFNPSQSVQNKVSGGGP